MALVTALSLIACVGCASSSSSSTPSGSSSTSSTEPSTEQVTEGTTESNKKTIDPERLADGDKAIDEYFEGMGDNYLTFNSAMVAESVDSAGISGSKKKSVAGGGASIRIPDTKPTTGKPHVVGEKAYEEKGFIKVSDNAISTFGADVDTASFSLLRNAARYGNFIDANQIRTEEIINYFNYNYNEPQGDDIFGVNTQICDCPWNEEAKLMSIGLQAKKVSLENREPMNIVFLIDTSGSMSWCIESLKSGLISLRDQITADDTVSVVTYAGDWDIPIEGIKGKDFDKIEEAISELRAGGVTNGSGGINTAYEVAQKYFIDGGNNRVVLLTDGDFNMGITSADDLRELISKNRDTGIFLSVMGFGPSANGDLIMETLADRGNGNYNNISDETDARKALIEDFAGNMFTIAKDTKLKVEFSADTVAEYRLIGYENRALTKEEYENDAVDSGDVGLGHQVTALYEIIPVKGTDFGADAKVAELEVKYKKPTADRSEAANSYDITTEAYEGTAKGNIALAASVVEYVMLVSDSKFKGNSSIEDVKKLKDSSEIDDAYTSIYDDMIYNYSEDGNIYYIEDRAW